MRFRNALHITIDNFSSAFKLLLYRLVVGVLTFSLVYVILELSLDVIVRSSEASRLVRLIGEFFEALLHADRDYLAAFKDDFTGALTAFLRLIGENGGAIAGAVAGVCLIYLLSRFLNGVSHFAAAGIMNDRMSAFSRTSFGEAFFRDLRRAAQYEVIYVPVSFVYDALTLLACWFLFFYLPSLFPMWGFLSVLFALSLTLAVYVCMQALKLTVAAMWIPAVIAGKTSVGKGLALSLRHKKHFWSRFASFVVANYLIVVVNTVFAVFTLGSAVLVTVPLSYLLLLALQFVHYYEDGGKKYFISVNNIAGSAGTEYPSVETLSELSQKLNTPAEEPADGTDDGSEND